MRTLLARLSSLFRRRRLDRDLDEEIAAHLSLQEAEFRTSGMTPEAAHAAALREFGGVAQAKEDYRERRSLPWIETAWRDVRYAIRGLIHNPGFAAAAILSLALGIGANTAIFSLFHSLMLRMLPVERPAELVSMFRTGGWGRGFVSYPLYQEIARRSDLFTGVIGRSGVAKVRFTSRAGARGEFTQREFVTGNYFSMLGVSAAIGRVFTDDDNRTQGAHPVAVISYDLWRNRYGADPNVLGARILVAEKPFTIIGVAAAGFHGVEFERRAEVWVPAAMADAKLTNPNSWWIWVVARRRPEVPVQQVQAAIDVLMRQHLNAIYPSGYDAGMRRVALGQRLEVRDAAIGLSLLRDEFSRPLAILLGAVVLVLLAACVNVANLLLARGAARRKEIALRLSLGATRKRLVTQALTESVLLAITGSALGAGLAGWGQQLVMQFLPEQAGNPFSNALSVPVLAFTLAISAMSVLLFGLGPALRSTSIDPAAGLRPGSMSRTPLLLRRVLVVAQVAFSVVLVAMAALFGHNLYALRGVDLGFRNQNVVAFSLDFPRELRREERVSTHQLAAQLAELPGVSSASYGFPGPFLMGTSSASVRVPDSERTSLDPVDVQTANIAPHYFATIGARLTAGREFEPGDTESARKVAVVNEAFVREFLPGENHPELRRLTFDGSKAEEGEPIFIVGVVRDIRHSGIQAHARPTVYVPIEQRASAIGPTMLVRTQASPTAMLSLIYRELRRVNPSIAVTDLRTLRSQVDDSIFEQRLLAVVGAFFGALALVLAAVGLYGVVAYATARRTAEIGLRIALGARRPQVIWMILRDSLAMVACGLAIGLPAALVSARAVQSLLFEIRPGDPPALLVTGLTLAIAGVGAAYLPARRAASVDPARVLRAE